MNLKTTLATLLLTATLANAGTSYTASTPTTTPTLPKVSTPISERFYIDLAGGVTFLQDGPDGIGFENGYSITGAFGVNLGHGLSVELESGYLSNDIEDIELNGNKFTGDISSVPILANVKYLIPVTSHFNFYIGGGLGAIYSEGSFNFNDFGYSADGWDFAFQGLAGISIPLSEVLSLEVGYRYLATGFNSEELRAHGVEAGINFKF